MNCNGIVMELYIKQSRGYATDIEVFKMEFIEKEAM